MERQEQTSMDMRAWALLSNVKTRDRKPCQQFGGTHVFHVILRSRSSTGPLESLTGGPQGINKRLVCTITIVI